MLYQLIYFSSVAKGTKLDDVERIIAKAQSFNAEAGISGFFIFTPERFLQAIEGSREKVNALYNRIVSDPRHTGATLLSYGQISSRDFPAWSMKYCSMKDIASSDFFHWTSQQELDPATLAPESARGLLKALSARAS